MIDYDQIINPINSLNRCGVDLRDENNPSEDYKNLKSLRSQLRQEERKDLDTNGTLAINKDWQEIISLASKILISDSKDLEVAVWLLEGLTRIEGLHGLSVGFHVLYSLLKEYELQELYPKPIDEEAEDILLPIIMLSGKYEAGTIIVPIYFCPLIQTKDGISYTGWELKKILQGENQNRLNYDVKKEQILASSEMQEILPQIDTNYLLELRNNITGAIDNFKKLNITLTEKFGRNAPNLDNIHNVLKYCYSLSASTIALLKLEEKEEQSTPLPADQIQNYKGSLDLNNLDESMLDKKLAQKLLTVLVKFFKTTEAHSPVSYMLDRALGLSKLTLPEILCDLIPDEEMRMDYCRFSGVPFIRN